MTTNFFENIYAKPSEQLPLSYDESRLSQSPFPLSSTFILDESSNTDAWSEGMELNTIKSSAMIGEEIEKCYEETNMDDPKYAILAPLSSTFIVHEQSQSKVPLQLWQLCEDTHETMEVDSFEDIDLFEEPHANYILRQISGVSMELCGNSFICDDDGSMYSESEEADFFRELTTPLSPVVKCNVIDPEINQCESPVFKIKGRRLSLMSTPEKSRVRLTYKTLENSDSLINCKSCSQPDSSHCYGGSTERSALAASILQYQRTKTSDSAMFTNEDNTEGSSLTDYNSIAFSKAHTDIYKYGNRSRESLLDLIKEMEETIRVKEDKLKTYQSYVEDLILKVIQFCPSILEASVADGGWICKKK